MRNNNDDFFNGVAEQIKKRENDEEEDLGENPHANTIEIGTDKMKKEKKTCCKES